MALSPKRYWRKLALTSKLETDYGVSSAPTGAANAMEIYEVTLTPIAAEEEQVEVMRPWFGHQGTRFVGRYAQIEFFVPFAGSGAAGTAPAYGSLLRACSMAEAIVATTSVTYTPVTDGPESVTHFANLDGVNHAMLGSRGTWQVEFSTKRSPRLRLTFRGLLGPITDMALPASVFTAWKKPKPVSAALTTMSLHGTAQIAESLTIDIKNDLVTHNMIGEDSIQITDRKTTGNAVVEAKPLATKNWFAINESEATGALAFAHGVTPGYIVGINASAVQIGPPGYGQTNGITNNSLPLIFQPTLGNDDFSIVLT